VTRPERDDLESLRAEPVPARSAPEAAAVPDLYAIHHVTVPVDDVLLSSDWYASVLGLDCIMVFEQEERVEEALLAHPGGLVLHLVAAPERAAGLAGSLAFADPSGIRIALHTREQPSADEG
jgi:hypothetical protein